MVSRGSMYYPNTDILYSILVAFNRVVQVKKPPKDMAHATIQP